MSFLTIKIIGLQKKKEKKGEKNNSQQMASLLKQINGSYIFEK